jgi:hypothetical protein
LGIENPCVGGSIPPRATKIRLTKKPAHAVGFFVSQVQKSLCPVYFRAAAFFGKRPPLLPLSMRSQCGPCSSVDVSHGHYRHTGTEQVRIPAIVTTDSGRS